MKMTQYKLTTFSRGNTYHFPSEELVFEFANEFVTLKNLGQFVYDTFLFNIHTPNEFEDGFPVEPNLDLDTMKAIAEMFDIQTLWNFCEGNKYLRHEFCDWFGFEIEECR